MTDQNEQATPQAGAPEAPCHLPALDGLRGLAILLVLIHHETVFTPTTPIEQLVHRVLTMGWCGVDLFFVISGFLITGILIDARDRPGYFRSFYARRVLRIFPLYYALVLFAFVILPALPLAKAQAMAGRVEGQAGWYFSFLSNVLIAIKGRFDHPLLDVSWSLAIEEQYYLVWPFVVWALGPRRLPWLCLFLLVASFTTRVAMIETGASPVAVYVLTPCRLDALAVGSFIAAVLRFDHGPALIERWARRLSLPAVGLSVVCLASSKGGGWEEPATLTVGFVALAAAFGCGVALGRNPDPTGLPGRLLRARWLRLFGQLSYGLYLVHLPVRALIRDHVLRPVDFARWSGTPLVGQGLFFVVATAAALLVAHVSWVLLERPFLRLKRLVPTPRPPARTAGVASAGS